ncbi:hypothetical protein AAF712_013619 [Marasmius tenuissimus]|uniref:Uncharacterized protein n=1 Tax=Marasmius tenuissimus TaxID=585030 RepID=A0ABR2ZFD7_9AGAR
MSLPSLGLGKDGVHSFANWANDVGRALETRIGQYTAVPSSVEINARRNTVFGGESSSHVRSETTGRAPVSSTLGRAMSTRTLGLRAEVPHGVDTARSSIVSMNRDHIPASAASTVTLFDDFAAAGPQAESTPHNNGSHKRITEEDDVPPLPTANQLTGTNRNSRRSSIVYIKSDENATVTPPNHVNNANATSSTSSSLAQWSSRAVRPLIPKSAKLLRKVSKASPPASSAAQDENSKPESPKTGLRPLSLLQARDTNADFNSNGVVETVVEKSNTRPLILGKKQKSRGAPKAGDENANPVEPLRTKAKHNLKPLKLARSETSKMRGILRAQEEVPNVVVRPPSTVDQYAYAYNFRD